MNSKGQSRRRDIRTRHKRQDAHRGRTFSLMLVCIVVLVAGFFFAARQHFSSMDYGIKNSRLRKQIDELETEKRRLILAREVTLSPGEIRRSAKKVGIVNDAIVPAPEMAKAVIPPVRDAAKDKDVEKSNVVPAVAVAQQKPLVVKTAEVAPAKSRPAPAIAALQRSERIVRQPARGAAVE